MKIIYLLPPSEGKNTWGNNTEESLKYNFEKPLDIAKNATEKDLKCKEKRYEEGIALNTEIEISPKLPSIERYSWVMYNAIDYSWMSPEWKQYFSENFLILSGMYGILRPDDMIGNYKLPIETKWLYQFWGTQITDTLNALDVDVIVDFLPGSYGKMIQWKDIHAKIVRVNFLHTKDGELKKMTHGVKKVKWEYIKKLCESGEIELPGDISDDIYTLDIISP